MLAAVSTLSAVSGPKLQSFPEHLLQPIMAVHLFCMLLSTAISSSAKMQGAPCSQKTAAAQSLIAVLVEFLKA